MGLITLQKRKVGDEDQFTCSSCKHIVVMNSANEPLDPQPEDRLCSELHKQDATGNAELDESTNYCILYSPV